MRVSYILAIAVIVFNFYSCKNDKNATNEELVTNEIKQDSVSAKPMSDAKEINLEPVKAGIPTFSNAEAEAFVSKTKKYFEEVAEAAKNGDSKKALDLQLQSADIDTEFQKVKAKLNTEQQKQLTEWYMKLVEAASK